MKLYRSEKLLLVLTVLFVLFSCLYFLTLKPKAGEYTVQTAKSPPASLVQENPAGIGEQETVTPPDSVESMWKIDLNSADSKDLMALPGIGKTLADRIIEYREQNGRFEQTDELFNVRGIGEKTYEEIKDHVHCGLEVTNENSGSR